MATTNNQKRKQSDINNDASAADDDQDINNEQTIMCCATVVTPEGFVDVYLKGNVTKVSFFGTRVGDVNLLLKADCREQQCFIMCVHQGHTYTISQGTHSTCQSMEVDVSAAAKYLAAAYKKIAIDNENRRDAFNIQLARIIANR
jgi:hypothetical protein